MTYSIVEKALYLLIPAGTGAFVSVIGGLTPEGGVTGIAGGSTNMYKHQ